jgi:hypothetical protein
LRRPKLSANKESSVPGRRRMSGMSYQSRRCEIEWDIAVSASADGVIVTVKVQFTLEQATKAQRWSRGTTLLFL